MQDLTDDESAIVEVVRDFVDREVRPVARELDHTNTYPEAQIEQMKKLGIYGLAIPEPWGEAHVSAQCYAAVTEELARDAIRKIKVQYELMPHLVREDDLTQAGNRAK